MHKILEDHYPPGGTIIRAMAARLEAGRHHQASYRQTPLVPLRIGHVYEINNQKQHSVMNKGNEGRINFIFDYIPPSKIQR
jgi:hypothetical protein